MNRKSLIYIFGVVLILGIILVVYQNSTPKNANPEKSIKKEFVSANWEKKYDLKNRNPFGLYVFKELIFSDNKFKEFNSYSNDKIFDSIVDLDTSLFMFIGKNFTLKPDEYKKLMKSIYNGNELFISVENLPNEKAKQDLLYHQTAYFTHPKSKHKIAGKEYDFYYILEQDTIKGFWDFFLEESIHENAVKINKIENYGSSFIKIKHGSGNILIHLNPVIFTNHQLLKKEGKDYLKDVLKEFNHPNIQWLTFTQYEFVEYDYSEDLGNNQQNPSLLVEIFKHPAFRWGFILAVFGVVLYLLFRSKRRRPIVPTYDETKNTGFSYVDTLAGIYYSKNQPNKILKIMRQNLYDAVYAKFYIKIHQSEDRSFSSLSQKANIPEEEIQYLLKILENNGVISNDYLDKAYNLQRNFYFKSGIWEFQNKEKYSNKIIHVYRNKKQDFWFSIGGFLLILLGFILLAEINPLGVLLWPFGGIALFSGMRSLSTPAILISPEKIEWTPLIGFSMSISYGNIKFIEQKSEKIIITQKNNRKISFSLSNLEKNNIDILEQIKKNLVEV